MDNDAEPKYILRPVQSIFDGLFENLPAGGFSHFRQVSAQDSVFVFAHWPPADVVIEAAAEGAGLEPGRTPLAGPGGQLLDPQQPVDIQGEIPADFFPDAVGAAAQTDTRADLLGNHDDRTQVVHARFAQIQINDPDAPGALPAGQGPGTVAGLRLQAIGFIVDNQLSFK